MQPEIIIKKRMGIQDKTFGSIFFLYSPQFKYSSTYVTFLKCIICEVYLVVLCNLL